MFNTIKYIDENYTKINFILALILGSTAALAITGQITNGISASYALPLFIPTFGVPIALFCFYKSISCKKKNEFMNGSIWTILGATLLFSVLLTPVAMGFALPVGMVIAVTAAVGTILSIELGFCLIQGILSCTAKRKEPSQNSHLTPNIITITNDSNYQKTAESISDSESDDNNNKVIKCDNGNLSLNQQKI